MREYDPIERNPELMEREPIVTRDEDSGLGTLGIIAALAVAVAGGLYFFNSSNSDRVAMNEPSVTSGQALTTPDRGKADSN